MTTQQTCKLVVVGDGSAGKTSIIQQFINAGFRAQYKQTIGCDFFENNVELRGQTIHMSVRDIGGQSANSKNISNYISGASVVFLVYDVTSAQSLQDIEDWYNTIHHPTSQTQHCYFYLVGNKVDLTHLRMVTDAQHHAMISSLDLNGGFFTSAKSGENVLKSFYVAAGRACGVVLQDSELAAYDKVIMASISVCIHEGRLPDADAIEAEDLALEARKLERCCIIC